MRDNVRRCAVASVRYRQSRGPPQGGGVALSHKPVRGSLLFAPGLSSCEAPVTQPDINQTAARALNIDLMT